MLAWRRRASSFRSSHFYKKFPKLEVLCVLAIGISLGIGWLVQVPPSPEAQVPEVAVGEVMTTVTGKLQIAVSDDFKNNQSEKLFTIYEPTSRKSYRLNVPATTNTTTPSLTSYGVLDLIQSGATIQITAPVVGDSFKLSATDLKPLSSIPNLTSQTANLQSSAIKQLAPASSALPSGSIGAQAVETRKYLLFLANFKDDASKPIPDATKFQTAFNKVNGIKAFYNEVSYGKVALDVTFDQSWYTVDMVKPAPNKNDNCWEVPGDDQVSSYDQNTIFIQMLLNMVTTPDGKYKGTDLSAYDGVIVFTPEVSCGAIGTATLGKTSFTVHNVAKDLHYVRLSGFGYDGNFLLFLTHELGHNFGLDHAFGSDCGSDLIHTEPDSVCNYYPYGDPFDVMGGGFKNLTDKMGKTDTGWHFNSQRKISNNANRPWLFVEETQTHPYIKVDGETLPAKAQEYDIYPIESPLSTLQMKALHIDLPQQSWYGGGWIGVQYQIDYRRPSTAQLFDKTITDNQGNGLDFNAHSGALIRVRNISSKNTILIDTTPNSISSVAGYDFLDAALTVGKSVTLPGCIKVTTLSADATKARVRVEKVAGCETASVPPTGPGVKAVAYNSQVRLGWG